MGTRLQFSSMATTVDHELIASLLREQCALKCNPSRYMQRLMKGARGKGKHYDKMVHYKTMCTAGCQLAGTPSAYLPSSSLSSLQALASPDDDSDVQNGSEMDSSSETIQEMVRILREGCYEACSITCQES